MEFIRWSSFVGLALDLSGFSLLAYDVVASVQSEKQAWEEVLRVKRASFNRRHAFFAPGIEKRAEEEAAFNVAEDSEKTAFASAALRRKVRVRIGITLVLIGFAFQMVGAFPH